jgi:hypothetical protein
MACPNYLTDVQRVAAENPEAWRNAHTGNAHTEDFIRILAFELCEKDPRVGLNGKRGNPADISDDALNVLDPIDGPGLTPEGQQCWVVDVIIGAGGPDPEPNWNAYPDAESSTGAHVVPGPPPVDTSKVYPYPDEPTAGQAYQDRITAAYTEAGRCFPDPDDPTAFRHFMRYGYSSHEMPEPEAADKHIAELRAELGLTQPEVL